MYCFDTDTLSTVLRRNPPLALIRRLATIPPDAQFTTAITLGEMMYGAARRDNAHLETRVRDLIARLTHILPFDEPAAEVYGRLRARLDREGLTLAEPGMRIASIVLSRDLTLITGNVRHFARVPGLRVENWIP